MSAARRRGRQAAKVVKHAGRRHGVSRKTTRKAVTLARKRYR